MQVTSIQPWCRGKQWAGEALDKNGTLYLFECARDGTVLRPSAAWGRRYSPTAPEAGGFERWVQTPNLWLKTAVPPGLEPAVRWHLRCFVRRVIRQPA
jgi:hypothetical protein